MLLKPREYQVEAVNSIYSYFAKNTGNPIIAMPTGTGKSVVIAMFFESIFRAYPNQKVLCLTHVKELILQNYEKLLIFWPNAPAGIYSAGLNRKDTQQRIIFAGIASIVRRAKEFGHIDLVIIDEAHLVSPNEETMYRGFLNALIVVNPALKVIGLTATPWRLGQGSITTDGIFTDLCFNITDVSSFNRLIKEGFLCPVVPRRTETILDTDGVHMRGGEFIASELQLAVDKDEVTFAAIQEAIKHGAGRNSWLVFASGVEHAIKITQMLNHLGVDSRCVHSKMPGKERDTNIAEWKQGKFTAIVNNGIMTTGVDHPPLDLIIMLRPTASTVLWIQMLGRGTRPFPGKENCLVLDFAGNTKRLGPINDPVIPRKKGEKTGEIPVKICENCSTYNHLSARYCGGQPHKNPEGCGTEFIFQTKLKHFASTDALIKDDTPIVEEFKVDTITYSEHNKQGRPPSIRVSYFCGLRKFSEYVHFELGGFAERKAKEWWKLRSSLPFPISTANALIAVQDLEVPTHIKVWINKAFPEILNIVFDGVEKKKIIGDEVPF